MSGGDYFGASTWFAKYLALVPGDVEARWGAAIAFHHRGKPDSAAIQLTLMLDTLRQLQAARTATYLSLEFAEYALATAHHDAGQRDSARAALERALVEKLAYYPARMLLGDIALETGDTTAASEHWGAVAELARGDVVAQARFARFLARAGRLADAERELEAVIAREPHWVGARRALAVVLDSAGPPRRADAVRAYREYLVRAPREPVEPRRDAERRVAALSGVELEKAPIRVPD